MLLPSNSTDCLTQNAFTGQLRSLLHLHFKAISSDLNFDIEVLLKKKKKERKESRTIVIMR